MILDTTSKLIQVILDEAHTTTACLIQSDWVDTVSGSTFAPGNTAVASNGLTAVTAVGSPAASTQRSVKCLTVYNADTVSHVVTVRSYDGSTARPLLTVTLVPKQSLVYIDGSGWAVQSFSGVYLPLTGGTLTGGLNATTISASGALAVSTTGIASTITRTGVNGLGEAGIMTVASDGKTTGDGQYLLFGGLNSSSAALTYGTAGTVITDPTAGSEDAALTFRLLVNGAMTERVRFNSSGLGIGMTPVNALDITQSSATSAMAKILNSNSGTGAWVEFRAANGTSQARLMHFGASFTTSGLTRQNGTYLAGDGAGGLTLNTEVAQPIYIGVNNTEVAQISTSGNFGIGATPSVVRFTIKGTGSNEVLNVTTAAGPNMFYSGTANLTVATGENAADAMLYVRKDNTTSRSINAGGSINASGADYAEYERKARGTFAAGDVVGFNAAGQLTDLWDEAISFGVKSTNPCIVGGDVWGTEEALGVSKPTPPDEPPALRDKATAQDRQRHAKAMQDHAVALQAYEAAKAEFDAKLDAARQQVDRIAYSGKVPVNLMGAVPGDVILAAQDGTGIKPVAVKAPTFEQMRLAVGRVRRILPDGRAEIAVMVS